MIVLIPTKDKEQFTEFCSLSKESQCDFLNDDIVSEKSVFLVYDHFNEFEFGRMFENWLLTNKIPSES